MVRIVTVDERLVLTELKRLKPNYAPYIAAIQAAANEFVGPMGFLAYGIAKGHINSRVVNEYIAVSKDEFDAKIMPLSVSVDLRASPTADGLHISWTAQKGVGEPGTVPIDSGSYVIKGLAKDFSDDWAESLTLAVNRWSKFVNTLTSDMADKILKAAQIGYEQFILGNNPTAKQVLAAAKHKVRLLSVDRNYYVDQTKGAVQKYEQGYKDAKAKYAEVFRYVGDALYAATKLTISIFKVL